MKHDIIKTAAIAAYQIYINVPNCELLDNIEPFTINNLIRETIAAINDSYTANIIELLEMYSDTESAINALSILIPENEYENTVK